MDMTMSDSASEVKEVHWCKNRAQRRLPTAYYPTYSLEGSKSASLEIGMELVLARMKIVRLVSRPYISGVHGDARRLEH